MSELFDTSKEAMHRTNVIVTVVHRFPVGAEIVDVAGGHWRIREVVWRGRALYRLAPLDNMAKLSVLGGAVHGELPDHDRFENVATVDRHFNPA